MAADLGHLDQVAAPDAAEAGDVEVGGVWGGNLIKVAQIGSHVFYRLVGGGRATSMARSAPDLYSPADKPATAKTTADGEAPNLILASAVTTTKLGEGGPAGAAPEPASAPSSTGKAPGADKADAATADTATVKATS